MIINFLVIKIHLANMAGKTVSYVGLIQTYYKGNILIDRILRCLSLHVQPKNCEWRIIQSAPYNNKVLFPLLINVHIATKVLYLFGNSYAREITISHQESINNKKQNKIEINKSYFLRNSGGCHMSVILTYLWQYCV